MLVHTVAIRDVYRILTQLINNRWNSPSGAGFFNMYMHLCLSHVASVNSLFKHWLSIDCSGADLAQPCIVNIKTHRKTSRMVMMIIIYQHTDLLVKLQSEAFTLSSLLSKLLSS